MAVMVGVVERQVGMIRVLYKVEMEGVAVLVELLVKETSRTDKDDVTKPLCIMYIHVCVCMDIGRKRITLLHSTLEIICKFYN